MGLWPPDRRTDPSGPFVGKLRAALHSRLAELRGCFKQGLPELLALLKSEKLVEDPYPVDVVSGLYGDLQELAQEYTLDELISSREDPPAPQAIKVELIGALLRGLGDPDWEVFVDYSVGVPIGLDVDMPRTPLVYPAKTKWALPEQQALSEGIGPRDDFFGLRSPTMPLLG